MRDGVFADFHAKRDPVRAIGWPQFGAAYGRWTLAEGCVRNWDMVPLRTPVTVLAFVALAWSQGSAEAPVEVGEEVIEISPYVIEQLKPAVQFSCATSSTPTEDGLEADLAGSDTPSRLKALGRLLELEAPHSVALQYSALRELERSHGDHEAVRLAHTRFSSDWIENALRTAPPREDSVGPNRA